MSFDTTVDLTLKPSIKLLKIISSLHIVVLVLMVTVVRQGWPLLVLAAAVGGSWLWLRQHPALGFGPKAIIRLIWHGDDRWVLTNAAGQSFAASLRSDTHQIAGIRALRWHSQKGRNYTRLIAGDEAEPEPLRRLKARLSVWNPVKAAGDWP